MIVPRASSSRHHWSACVQGTATCWPHPMDDALTALAGSAAALPGLFVVVLADAFLVIIPGEVAVTAIAALWPPPGNRG